MIGKNSLRALARLLVIMGSGETSPTMVKTHRQVLERLGHPERQRVMLDTPFGFQENADEIAAKAQAYFSQSLNTTVELASFRSASEVDVLGTERFLAKIREASWVFAGPGSPSYALSQWANTGLAGALIDKLRQGGAITFSSAAALTLGASAVPVYEIYKVGEPPHWLAGLDILSVIGLSAAVIPHYNNAEGGGHDTRFCYLGERRLAKMERELDEDVFILGIDEHSGIVFDIDAGMAQVVGLGNVTVRASGQSHQLQSGSEIAIEQLCKIASDLRSKQTQRLTQVSGDMGHNNAKPSPSSPSGDVLVSDERATARSDGLAGGDYENGPASLNEVISVQEGLFYSAMEVRDVDRAVAATLELERQIIAWSADTLQSDELDRGRALLRSMIVNLAELAKIGARDPAEVVAPLVELALDLRTEARQDRRFQAADMIRDRLGKAGVEVRDAPGGSKWEIAGKPEL